MGVEEDTKAGKFSVESPKKLYKGSFIDGMFPFRKALFDKITAKGISLPDNLSAKNGPTEIKVTAKTPEVATKGKDGGVGDAKQVTQANVTLTYSDKGFSIVAAQKEPGKLDLVYKTDLDGFGLAGAKGTLKLEDRKGKDQNCVAGMNYATKAGYKLDVKAHPMRILAPEKGKKDVKAACFAPLVKKDGMTVSLGAEMKGNVASIATCSHHIALAASMKGIFGGVFYRAEEGKDTAMGFNASKKMEVKGKPAEFAVEVCKPKATDAAFTVVAASSVQLNKQWTLINKINNMMQLNVSLKHTPHPSYTVQVGTITQNFGMPSSVGLKFTTKF